MNLIYNSESFSVLQIDPATPDDGTPDPEMGGYEIVDKWARKGIFLRGELAQRFRAEAIALQEKAADPEALDDFIAGFTGQAQQPLVLH